MPSATLEAEYGRRINTVNAVAAFCSVSTDPISPSTLDEIVIILRQAMESVRIHSPEHRPTKYFLCINPSNLSLEDRVMEFANTRFTHKAFSTKTC
ncbi:uncharacterized protein ATNIH1004_000187 [Aspergillus tanneri]|uniref:Uncharacterized protein n=1 Tax=Aspergillus tanneri TaxID=1220188 RepID=A0A5M9MZ88_9EURO|nr:uncharacterized protein ATNIH1004_000187 [Aspergillus tanneri]KAA8651306.1 hypothetical protein ATNIH1004_000187 [Aspergillus tanneri]